MEARRVLTTDTLLALGHTPANINIATQPPVYKQALSLSALSERWPICQASEAVHDTNTEQQWSWSKHSIQRTWQPLPKYACYSPPRNTHTYLELLVDFLAVMVKKCQIKWPEVSIKATQSVEMREREWNGGKEGVRQEKGGGKRNWEQGREE